MKDKSLLIIAALEKFAQDAPPLDPDDYAHTGQMHADIRARAVDRLHAAGMANMIREGRFSAVPSVPDLEQWILDSSRGNVWVQWYGVEDVRVGFKPFGLPALDQGRAACAALAYIITQSYLRNWDGTRTPLNLYHAILRDATKGATLADKWFMDPTVAAVVDVS